MRAGSVRGSRSTRTSWGRLQRRRPAKRFPPTASSNWLRAACAGTRRPRRCASSIGFCSARSHRTRTPSAPTTRSAIAAGSCSHGVVLWVSVSGSWLIISRKQSAACQSMGSAAPRCWVHGGSVIRNVSSCARGRSTRCSPAKFRVRRTGSTCRSCCAIASRSPRTSRSSGRC